MGQYDASLCKQTESSHKYEIWMAWNARTRTVDIGQKLANDVNSKSK